MSICNSTKVVCPKCKSESEFQVWSSINVQIDPAMKDKVLDDTAFLFTCPHCGLQVQVEYATLYHDMEKRFMVQFFPGGREKATNVASMLFGAVAQTGELDAGEDQDNYKLRVVESLQDLQEKVRIFEAGFDDRVIEVMKIVGLNILREHDRITDVDMIFFDRIDDTCALVFIENDEVVNCIVIDDEIYNHTVEEFKDLIDSNSSECYIYDSTWAESLLI